jgi:hypothetical protein
VLDIAAAGDGRRMFGSFRSRFRYGSNRNILINPDFVRDSELLNGGDTLTLDLTVMLRHKAHGAKFFRVTKDGGKYWSPWVAYQPLSYLNLWPWGGGWREVEVQYWVDDSAAYFVSGGIDVVYYDGLAIEDFGLKTPAVNH